MITEIPPYSDKLSKYLNFIQSETGREIALNEIAEVGLQGMNFAFRPDFTTKLNIYIVLPYRGSKKDFESQVAHEATHGLLIYKRDYRSPEPL